MRKPTNRPSLPRSVMFFLLFLCLGYPIMAQVTISGTVSDQETGELLPGVNVLVKGTFIGSVTNLDGVYSIEVDDGQAILQFSFIGYLTKELDVGIQTNINIELTPDRIDPYIAAEPASFRASKDSMLSGGMWLISSTITPSTTKRGLELLMVPVPRILISNPEPGNPEFCVT